jgi:uncharacterized coiled-coil DUF342 family protein
MDENAALKAEIAELHRCLREYKQFEGPEADQKLSDLKSQRDQLDTRVQELRERKFKTSAPFQKRNDEITNEREELERKQKVVKSVGETIGRALDGIDHLIAEASSD